MIDVFAARSLAEQHAPPAAPPTSKLSLVVAGLAADALGCVIVAKQDDRVSEEEFDAFDELAEDLEAVLDHVLAGGAA